MNKICFPKPDSYEGIDFYHKDEVDKVLNKIQKWVKERKKHLKVNNHHRYDFKDRTFVADMDDQIFWRLIKEYEEVLEMLTHE